MEHFTKKWTENTEQGYLGESDRLYIHTNLLISEIQLRVIQIRSKK